MAITKRNSIAISSKRLASDLSDEEDTNEEEENNENFEPSPSKRRRVSSSGLSFREAAIEVLRHASRPLSAKELVEEMIKQKLIETTGKTPDRTVAARIYSDIKQKGKASAFVQVAKGVFRLAEQVDKEGGDSSVASTFDDNEEPAVKKTSKKKKKTSSKKPKKQKIEKKAEQQQQPLPESNEDTEPEDNEAPKQPEAPILKKKKKEEYNDDFGYLYLRYFLETTKRQERQDSTPEDECFVCKSGGDLICCDFPDCAKVYHLSCLGMKSIPQGKWYCPWHFCVECQEHNSLEEKGKQSVHHCLTCTTSYCDEHLPNESQIRNIRKGTIICPTCMPYFKREIDE